MSESIFTQTRALLERVDQQLQPGDDFSLGHGMSIPHFRVLDTGLAACLGTLGVPFRDPAPYTDDVKLNAAGSEIGHNTIWWLGDHVPGATQKEFTTEWLGGAWIQREKFESENREHPFLPMRAALDARSRWCGRIAAWLANAAALPIDTPQVPHFHTDKIHAASVLEASGFVPLAFNRRTFFLTAVHDGRHAEDVLLEAAQQEGQKPSQWMARVLKNYSHLADIAKRNSVIIQQPFDGQTLILSADAAKKTRDFFMKLV